MRKFKTFLFVACAALFICVHAILPSKANDMLALSQVPQAALVGKGDLKFFFKHVYEARLFAPNGEWSGILVAGEPVPQPFALELIYGMGLKGADIARRSIIEMEKQGVSGDEKLARWQQSMLDIFPNVKDGTRLIGVMLANGETTFFNGEQEIGTITDPEFGVAFFNIWLSDKTSEPALRQKLLGQL